MQCHRPKGTVARPIPVGCRVERSSMRSTSAPPQAVQPPRFRGRARRRSPVDARHGPPSFWARCPASHRWSDPFPRRCPSRFVESSLKTRLARQRTGPETDPPRHPASPPEDRRGVGHPRNRIRRSRSSASRHRIGCLSLPTVRGAGAPFFRPSPANRREVRLFFPGLAAPRDGHAAHPRLAPGNLTRERSASAASATGSSRFVFQIGRAHV